MRGRGNILEFVTGALFVVGVYWALSLFGGCAGELVITEPARPRMAVQGREPPLAVADQDRALLSRLLPHFRQAAREEIEAEFKKAADDLDSADVRTGQRNVGGFGTTIAAAVAWFVQKAIRALFFSLLLGAVAGLFWAYWMYPAAFVACWTAVWTVVVKLIARSEARKAVEALKPAAPLQVTRLDRG